MPKYLVVMNEDGDYPQNHIYVTYIVEGAEQNDEIKSREYEYFEGVAVYEVEEGQEIIVSCVQDEYHPDEFTYINFKIKYIVKDGEAIPTEIYEFKIDRENGICCEYEKEIADWEKEYYYYRYTNDLGERKELELIGNEATEKMLKLASEKFIFYLKDFSENNDVDYNIMNLG